MELWIGAFVFVALIFIFIFSIGNYIDKAPARAEAKAKAAAELVKKHAEFLGNAESRLNELIQQHIKALAIKQHQTISEDAYGVIDASGWNSELDYFIDNVLFIDPLLFPYLSGAASGSNEDSHANILAKVDELLAKQSEDGRVPQREIDSIKTKMNSITNNHNARILEAKNLINDLVAKYRINEIENSTHTSIDVDKLDPIAFEHYCADVLRVNGWDARVTQASGDQGIDVIATRGNVKAVFQCKKFTQPVGNGAVQEIVAGRQFEQADVAAVVSNATYTPAAKQLAGTTGVHLLHYSELQGFANKLRIA